LIVYWRFKRPFKSFMRTLHSSYFSLSFLRRCRIVTKVKKSGRGNFPKKVHEIEKSAEMRLKQAGSGGQSSGAHTESSTAAAGAGVPRAGSLCELLPLPSASHALALIIDPLPAPIRNPLSLPPFPTPGLSISVSRAPFPCTSAAAGSHLASPQPPLRHQNHRIRWCFSAASASAAGRPLAALPAALRPSLR